MFYTYIIKSLTRNWYYVGITTNLSERFAAHLQGKNKSTKAYRPFKLIFVQISKTRMQARDLEKYLKVKYNKESIIKLIEG